MHDLSTLRQDYRRAKLDVEHLDDDPIQQFRKWFAEAVQAEVIEPNAMVLATVDEDGFPNSRVVLLKGQNEQGFTFFTSYRGAKARELAAGRRCASLTFHWKELERQVHIRGQVEKVSEAESDTYFAERPYMSRIGAWASEQSTVIDSRELLENRFADFLAKYPEGTVVPRPSHWGGYVVKPYQIEFWQGRPSRLHDRFVFTQVDPSDASKGWTRARLSP
jgi:pyridoxamine 5'-phosphate oxidase